GAGKSTMVAHLHDLTGWGIISDDVSVLCRSANEFHLESGVNTVKLWNDALQSLNRSSVGLKRDLSRFDKFHAIEPTKFVSGKFPLKQLIFLTWGLKGAYPKILNHKTMGTEAKKLLRDAQEMLEEVVNKKWLTAKAVIGLYPANTVNDDDIEWYTDDTRSEVLATFYNLRQQVDDGRNKKMVCLSDFVAPKETGIKDYCGGFAVTTGHGIEEITERYTRDHDDYRAIMAQAIADRLAEGFAECLHREVRRNHWGYAAEEAFSNEELIKEKYAGIRPAPGYPANPDHTEKLTLFKILEIEKHIGLSLTESLAMFPAAAVSGLYIGHPESYYFGIGRLAKDQVEDYAQRKGYDLEEMEKWLNPNLGY
ncbi:MAG: vitamin B12 dependent-methionine synthase activation domain-containing protein, partial [Bacteroidota bacterium]